MEDPSVDVSPAGYGDVDALASVVVSWAIATKQINKDMSNSLLNFILFLI